MLHREVYLMAEQELQSYLCSVQEVGDLRYLSWSLPRLPLTQIYLDQVVSAKAVASGLGRQSSGLPRG